MVYMGQWVPSSGMSNSAVNGSVGIQFRDE